MERYHQYRPISSHETGTDSPLAVRSARTAADNINNYAAWVARFKAFQLWSPLRSASRVQSHLGVDTEQVIAVSAGRWLPPGPLHFTTAAKAQRVAGSGTTTWRVYCSGIGYWQGVTFDESGITQDYGVTEFEFNTDTCDRKVSQDMELVRLWNNLSYFIVTAENSDSSTQSVLLNLDVSPEFNWTIYGTVLQIT